MLRDPLNLQIGSRKDVKTSAFVLFLRCVCRGNTIWKMADAVYILFTYDLTLPLTARHLAAKRLPVKRI